MQRSHLRSFAPSRWASGIIATTLIVLGCSGGGASPAGTESPGGAPGESAASTSAPGASAAPGESAAPNVDPGGAALNSAVVTIGSDRYEFTGVRCDILTAKYIQAGNYGGDPEVIIVLPPDGWESQPEVYGAPSVIVQVGDGTTDGSKWVAGDEGWFGDTYPAGESQIDDYSVPDGRPVTATGTATFSDQAAILFGRPSEPRTGTFEVTCP